MAPITVIMLHVNWLMGGIVIVEVVFGYPGLGKYLLDSRFKQRHQCPGSRRHDSGHRGGRHPAGGRYHLYVFKSANPIHLTGRYHVKVTQEATVSTEEDEHSSDAESDMPRTRRSTHMAGRLSSCFPPKSPSSVLIMVLLLGVCGDFCAAADPLHSSGAGLESAESGTLQSPHFGHR